MSLKFDELIRKQRRTDAGRYLADELYKNGKTGHTGKLLIEWLSNKVDEQEKEIEELNQAKHLACKKSEYYRKIQERYNDALHIIKTVSIDETIVDFVKKTLFERTKEQISGLVQESCQNCIWKYKEHCSNGASDNCTEAVEECNTCDHWEGE